jgi:hypothetical protein
LPIRRLAQPPDTTKPLGWQCQAVRQIDLPSGRCLSFAQFAGTTAGRNKCCFCVRL